MWRWGRSPSPSGRSGGVAPDGEERSDLQRTGVIGDEAWGMKVAYRGGVNRRSLKINATSTLTKCETEALSRTMSG
jgi:hypothetical protein